MGVYIYCIKEDYIYKSSITGRELENEWFRLDKDGTIRVKGTNKRGYAWDGCSPKWKIKDIYFGTPESVLNYETRQSKTYYASLIHDIFYQFNREAHPLIGRREVDREFYNILKRDGFVFARPYYRAVRLFGWIFWEEIMKNTALFAAGIIFLIAAILHFLRLLFKIPVMTGNFIIPVWPSAFACIAALALSIWMFKARKH